MKKMLSILSAFIITATSATSIISCTIGHKSAEYLPPVLQEQNFRFVQKLVQKYNDSIDQENFTLNSMFNQYSDNGKELLFTNGIYNNNVTTDDLKGTFNAVDGSPTTIINKLNTSLKLGLKIYANDTTISYEENDLTKKDILQTIDYGIENFYKLKNVHVDKIEEQLKEVNKSPIDLKDNEFDDILNKRNFENWKDGVYVRQIFLSYQEDEETEKLETKITQIIKLDNTKILINGIKDLRDKFNLDDHKEENSKEEEEINDKWNGTTYTFQEVYDKIIDKLDLFEISKQDNNAALVLDGNFILNNSSGLISIENNIDNVLNEEENEINKKIIKQYLDKWNTNNNNNNNNLYENETEPEPPIEEKMDLKDVNWDEIDFKVRVGQNKTDFENKIINFLKKQIKEEVSDLKLEFDYGDNTTEFINKSFIKIQAKEEENFFKGEYDFNKIEEPMNINTDELKLNFVGKNKDNKYDYINVLNDLLEGMNIDILKDDKNKNNKIKDINKLFIDDLTIKVLNEKLDEENKVIDQKEEKNVRDEMIKNIIKNNYDFDDNGNPIDYKEYKNLNEYEVIISDSNSEKQYTLKFSVDN